MNTLGKTEEICGAIYQISIETDKSPTDPNRSYLIKIKDGTDTIARQSKAPISESMAKKLAKSMHDFINSSEGYPKLGVTLLPSHPLAN